MNTMTETTRLSAADARTLRARGRGHGRPHVARPSSGGGHPDRHRRERSLWPQPDLRRHRGPPERRDHLPRRRPDAGGAAFSAGHASHRFRGQRISEKLPDTRGDDPRVSRLRAGSSTPAALPRRRDADQHRRSRRRMDGTAESHPPGADAGRLLSDLSGDGAARPAARERPHDRRAVVLLPPRTVSGPGAHADVPATRIRAARQRGAGHGVPADVGGARLGADFDAGVTPSRSISPTIRSSGAAARSSPTASAPRHSSSNC